MGVSNDSFAEKKKYSENICFVTSPSPGDGGRGLLGTGKEKFLPSALGGGLPPVPSKVQHFES